MTQISTKPNLDSEKQLRQDLIKTQKQIERQVDRRNYEIELAKISKKQNELLEAQL